MSRTYKVTPAVSTTSKSFHIDYEKLLNEQQLKAATEFEGPILCIAGAGSGKTRTIIYRVARMIESGIPSESILLLTYTRKAARNMLDSVSELLGAEVGKVTGGTYHSFATKILRQYGSYLNLSPSFSIIDEADSADIINLIRVELGFNSKETRFPQKKTISKIFSAAVNLEKTIAEIVTESHNHFEEHTDALTSIFNTYQTYKRENQLLGYDDLLAYLYELLARHSDARALINRKYQYVMADEYQDTNAVQARITMLLGGENNNIMVVGDDSQSIYSFRGARVQNILQFPQNFPNTRILRLEQNYRSTSSILHAANTLMKSAKEGFSKKLYTLRDKGELPALISCMDEQEQAAFVASRILDLREQGVKLSDIAVLFRSGFHAHQLELELKKRNIPYVKWGGYKFLESTHLKDIIAHLRVIQNPYDKVSWLRILLLLEGIGTKSASNIFEVISNSGDPYDLTAIKIRPSAEDGLTRLSKLLHNCGKLIDGQPSRLIDLIVEYYYPILKKSFDNYPKRLRDIDQLALLSQNFKYLADFLEELVLEPPKDAIDDGLNTQASDDETLVLSTIHSSKGLEWHSVFIIQAIEGRFPSFTSLGVNADLEEERRLMYVAMTRARENLGITYPAQVWDHSSASLLFKPSRFIEEIGADNLEKWQITR